MNDVLLSLLRADVMTEVIQKLSLFREMYNNGQNESDKDKALKLYGVNKEA